MYDPLVHAAQTPTSADAFIAPELYKLMNCGAKPPDSPEL
jgi:hypothetical protein